MMGHGFKADMKLMTKERPKDQDRQAIDLSLFKASANNAHCSFLNWFQLTNRLLEKLAQVY
jgi:hypothetical protein